MKKKVLIVDDSDFDRMLLSSALAKKTDLDILEAKNSTECLKLLKAEKIDLVLLDILMPKVSGEQVLKKIRLKYNAIELPVIMVTAKTDVSDIINCLQMGANDYITKPVTFDVVVSRITTHLKLSELSNEMSKLKEIYALNAMIATYNHEINNPLTIAIHCAGHKDLASDDIRKKLADSLWRISDIVKKICAVADRDVKFENYTDKVRMISLKK